MRELSTYALSNSQQDHARGSGTASFQKALIKEYIYIYIYLFIYRLIDVDEDIDIAADIDVDIWLH